jgi:hypothetical protein
MDLSDHAHILHTRVFKGKEFNDKSFICRKLTVLEIFENLKIFHIINSLGKVNLG